MSTLILYFEMVILNNLLNSDAEMMVGILLIMWTKEFAIAKGSYSKDGTIVKNNQFTNGVITTMVMVCSIALIPNSLASNSPKKIFFYFIIKLANLGILSVYCYSKGKGTESPFRTEYK